MPKKNAADDASEPLIIKNRHMMSESRPPAIPDAAGPDESSDTPGPKPELTIDREDSPTVATDSHVSSAHSENPPDSSTATHSSVQSDKKSDVAADGPAKDSAEAAPETSADQPKTETSAPPEASHTNATGDQQPETTADEEGNKANLVPDAKQTTEDAAQAEAREQELESLIEDKKFFVPVNTVAQKKSVKVSLGLTLLVVFLAVVLIDLMLDSGVILLVQKIPHTHFFSVKPPSE